MNDRKCVLISRNRYFKDKKLSCAVDTVADFYFYAIHKRCGNCIAGGNKSMLALHEISKVRENIESQLEWTEAYELL
jgi:hypothetical protein